MLAPVKTRFYDLIEATFYGDVYVNPAQCSTIEPRRLEVRDSDGTLRDHVGSLVCRADGTVWTVEASPDELMGIAQEAISLMDVLGRIAKINENLPRPKKYWVRVMRKGAGVEALRYVYEVANQKDGLHTRGRTPAEIFDKLEALRADSEILYGDGKGGE